MRQFWNLLGKYLTCVRAQTTPYISSMYHLWNQSIRTGCIYWCLNLWCLNRPSHKIISIIDISCSRLNPVHMEADSAIDNEICPSFLSLPPTFFFLPLFVFVVFFWDKTSPCSQGLFRTCDYSLTTTPNVECFKYRKEYSVIRFPKNLKYIFRNRVSNRINLPL